MRSGAILGLANNAKGCERRVVINPDVKCMQRAVLSGKRERCGTCWWLSAKLEGDSGTCFACVALLVLVGRVVGVVCWQGIGGNCWGVGSGASAVCVEVGALAGKWHWHWHAHVGGGDTQQST
jgi:hypothetical protein